KGIKNNFDEMPRYEDFASEFGLKFIPSYTNFIAIFTNEEKNSSILAENLLKKGIILRNLKSYGLNAVRITIGTKKQNDKVLEALRAEFA
ncbi:MAG: histidinol-phosphate transaminase, partial [Campylobacter sp.]|nr:histidinol-phosphate transaminase [Campylobacter sp.]